MARKKAPVGKKSIRIRATKHTVVYGDLQAKKNYAKSKRRASNKYITKLIG